CHTPSSFFSSVLAASSPPGGRPTQRRATPNNIARPQCVLLAYLHALNNGPDLGRPRRFSPACGWRGSRRATPGRLVLEPTGDGQPLTPASARASDPSPSFVANGQRLV